MDHFASITVNGEAVPENHPLEAEQVFELVAFSGRKYEVRATGLHSWTVTELASERLKMTSRLVGRVIKSGENFVPSQPSSDARSGSSQASLLYALVSLAV